LFSNQIYGRLEKKVSYFQSHSDKKEIKKCLNIISQPLRKPEHLLGLTFLDKRER
jgi:hypothetical protein